MRYPAWLAIDGKSQEYRRRRAGRFPRSWRDGSHVPGARRLRPRAVRRLAGDSWGARDGEPLSSPYLDRLNDEAAKNTSARIALDLSPKVGKAADPLRLLARSGLRPEESARSVPACW